jgi:hypothetical protein
VSVRAAVRAALEAHGIAAGADESAQALRERLNEVYLEEVRALKARQRGGEIALRDYAAHVDALRARFPLLSLPLSAWEE